MLLYPEFLPVRRMMGLRHRVGLSQGQFSDVLTDGGRKRRPPAERCRNLYEKGVFL